MDSDDEEISIDSDESISIDMTSQSKTTNLESDGKIDGQLLNIKLKGSIKALVKKQISQLFCFEASVSK